MDKKSVLILVDDYWHPKASIEPLVPLLFPADTWNAYLTTDPEELVKCDNVPDLFVSFKDPIENDQIPTPIWCDEGWSNILKNDIEAGMGFLAIHCGLTDLPREHVISEKVLRACFVTHPPQCPVTFIPKPGHPITEGISEFTFPDNDEHYVIELLPKAQTEILGYTTSVNGRQPALWAHGLGAGRVCAITPGHNTVNLVFPEYLKLLKNAAKWCVQR